MSSIKLAVIYHSGYGHTKVLAESVLAGAAAVEGVEVDLIEADKAAEQVDTLKDYDGFIFGSPTYMGSVSAQFKGFMDASSKAWFTQEWKDKIGAGFTVSASQSGDKLNTLIQLSVFGAQHGLIWVGQGLPPGNNSSQGSIEDLNRLGSNLGLMAQANSDEGPDVAPPAQDHATARVFGQRVAEAAKRWHAA